LLRWEARSRKSPRNTDTTRIHCKLSVHNLITTMTFEYTYMRYNPAALTPRSIATYRNRRTTAVSPLDSRGGMNAWTTMYIYTHGGRGHRPIWRVVRINFGPVTKLSSWISPLIYRHTNRLSTGHLALMHNIIYRRELRVCRMGRVYIYILYHICTYYCEDI